MNTELSLINKLERDVEFLSRISKIAGAFRSSPARNWGSSSNSLCSYAYDIIPRDKVVMPSDVSDLKACERLFNDLPKHRKTDRVKRMLKKQQEAV